MSNLSMTSMIVPVLVAFAISMVLGPIIIPFLRRLKFGQTEREDGVKSHLKKAGTYHGWCDLPGSYHNYLSVLY